MRKFAIPGLIAALMANVAVVQAQEAPQMPVPQKEHQWLLQFAGEWETEAEATMEPGKPPIKCKGTESARTVGGFWMIAENKGKFMDMPVTGVMTLGYDPEKKKWKECRNPTKDRSRILTIRKPLPLHLLQNPNGLANLV